MTRLLASVRNLEESRLAVEGGADIVDLKEPARGALGAVPTSVAREVVQELGGRCPVSATVGDLPMAPEVLVPAVQQMGDAGVNFVKIGVFASGDSRKCIRELASLAHRLRLVAVLFADRDPDLTLLTLLRDSGFAGVMLDTVGKDGRGLRACMAEEGLSRFVASAHGLDLLAGLAGSLRAFDVPALLPYAPDFLGFRGALCAGGDRTGSLDPCALRDLRLRISGS